MHFKKIISKKLFLMVLLNVVFFSASPLFANPKASSVSTPPICGAWKLISATKIDKTSGQKTQPYGKHPQGMLIYLPDGHMSALMVSDDRAAPLTKAITPTEATALFSDMISYSGTYTIKDHAIIHHVLVAWDPRWTGTDKIRYYTLAGNRLTLTILGQSDKKQDRSILVWEKT